MARIARVAYPDCPYHVTHRGNHRELVFLHDTDRVLYLEFLREEAERCGLDVWAYCLMPNHVHLIVTGRDSSAMAGAIGHAHRRHSRRINRREGWTGHLWANRFYSTPLDDRHLWVAARYVELNPVRAGLAVRPEEFPWSSARAHLFGADDPILAETDPFAEAPCVWRDWLAAGADPAPEDAIRRNTATGRPTGSEAFVRRIESALGRTLAPRRRGRKPSNVAGSEAVVRASNPEKQ